MADTKQATPDFEKIALEMFQNCALRGEDEEIWHDVAKGAAILKKHWLASRSGPDRTPADNTTTSTAEDRNLARSTDESRSEDGVTATQIGTGNPIAAQLVGGGPDRTTQDFGNYVCNDVTYPTQVVFDNGRVVSIVPRDDGSGLPCLAISPKSEYPKPCGICDGVIQSKSDLDWHGYGNCRDIPDAVLAGPDRGQQDAPDDYLDAADARFEAEYAPKTDYKWDYDSYIAGWNDAPAFDPQIVEALECADEMERQRRGKSSDSEKQG